MRATTESHIQARQQPKPKIYSQHKNNENQQKTPRKTAPAKDADYHQLVARATKDAVRDWNLANDNLTWPQGLHTLLGYSQGKSDQTIAFWQRHVHGSDRSRTAASIRDVIKSKGEYWSGEYRFRHAKGHYVQLLERALIVRDSNGHPVRFIGVLMDVTARKQLHDQLSHSQKMEAFGQLAGGVAHDFNNFLTSILGYSDLVLVETGGKGPVANHVNEIRKAAGRASALANQLLAFNHRHGLDPVVVEVNSILLNLERTLLRLLGENITVACHLHQDNAGAYIKVDPGQMTQIIINLALNGRDAMPRGGQLTLET